MISPALFYSCCELPPLWWLVTQVSSLHLLTLSLTPSACTLVLFSVQQLFLLPVLPFSDVFTGTSCVFSQPFFPNVMQDVLLPWAPSRLGAWAGDQQSWPKQSCFSYAASGNQGLNRWPGSAQCLGTFEGIQAMTWFDPYLGSAQCVLLSELHACWEFGGVIPRNGQCFVCCLLVENLLRLWSKGNASGDVCQGAPRAHRVTHHVSLAQQWSLGSLYLLSSQTDGVVCIPWSTPHYKAIAVVASSKCISKSELASGCPAATGTCIVWPQYMNLADWWPVECLQDLTGSQLVAGFARFGLCVLERWYRSWFGFVYLESCL